MGPGINFDGGEVILGAGEKTRWRGENRGGKGGEKGKLGDDLSTLSMGAGLKEKG